MGKPDYIFISHSSEDRKLATALCHFLEEKGLRCWITPRDIKPGKDYAQSIIEAIHMSSVMILIFTKNANTSKHVKNEVERCFSMQLTIIPFRVENIIPESSLEYFLSSTHWLDAYEGKPEYYFEEVYRNCSSLINQTTRETPAAVPVKPPRKSNSTIKPVYWILSICVAALLLIFYFTNKKDSLIDKADRITADSTTAVQAPANNKENMAVDTGKHDPGKASIKDTEKTSPVSQKVTQVKKDDEIPATEETEPLSIKPNEDLESVNGSTYEASNSTDDLMFTALPNNKLSFTGSIDEYPVSGKLKPVGNKKYTVIESINTKGNLSFLENDNVVSGTFYIKSSEPSHGFKLTRKQ